MRIGILSDTHGLLRAEVKELLKGCDFILHAGDIDQQRIIEELEEIAPVYAVRGNADKGWAEHLPISRSMELGGKKFFLIHNKKHIAEDAERKKEAEKADFIVYGHSHRYEEKQMGEQWILNPGSCGMRRFSLPITMMVMEISEAGNFSFMRKDIAGEKPVSLPAESQSLGGRDMASLVAAVIREMNRGNSVEQIAGKLSAEQKLVEQICRMYATHPGIDTDGILNRIMQ